MSTTELPRDIFLPATRSQFAGSRSATYESTQEQDVSIERELDLHFMPRRTIHTGNSYKFADQGLRRLS
jgi:hypothetical protein